MNFESALAATRSNPSDADLLAELARAALAQAEEERALPFLERVVRDSASPRLWQWKGLLERALDEHEKAIDSFAQAARLAPSDATIAHGHARVALEAGLDAEALFEHARRLDPQNDQVVIGLMAARMAVGRGNEAERELDLILRSAPLWVQGHQQLAKLRSLLGRPAEATTSLRQALDQHPSASSLWQALFDLHVAREEFEELSRAVASARAASVSELILLPYEAVAAAELGDTARADELFSALEAQGSPLPIWKIRHLLRSGRAVEAIPIIDAEIGSDRAAAAWPYAMTAWQITGDTRLEWLTGNGRLTSIVDLAGQLGHHLATLAALLRSIHLASGEYPDQSIRRGTQTDGPLFSRIEPEIRLLREAVVGAVERYISQLPAADARHPLLSQQRHRKIRFSGSWSVRLHGAGFHVSHVHPQGWISSALYLSLPLRTPGDDPHAGWLTLGQPPDGLGLDLAPLREVEPKEGQLVLFPSWMWHGTRPFAEGERLTVAFDVAPPR